MSIASEGCMGAGVDEGVAGMYAEWELRVLLEEAEEEKADLWAS